MGWAPNLTGVLINRGNLDTDRHTGRISCEQEDNDWGDAFTLQGSPRLPVNHQNSGEKFETDFCSQQTEVILLA